MAIDIDQLTEAELVDLNHRIVERMRLLQQMRAHKQMLACRIGDRVVFQADGRGSVEGMLPRYNRKSVTVNTDNGHHWTVSPGFLTRAAAPPRSEASDPSEAGPPQLAAGGKAVRGPPAPQTGLRGSVTPGIRRGHPTPIGIVRS